MSQIGLTSQPMPGNDVHSFIEFLNQRKKKLPGTPNPMQVPGSAPNASMFGGNTLMSPAMKSILGM